VPRASAISRTIVTADETPGVPVAPERRRFAVLSAMNTYGARGAVVLVWFALIVVYGLREPDLFLTTGTFQTIFGHVGGRFGTFAQMLLPLEYTNWVEENQAHVRSCYLGDWTPLNKVSVRGPEALDFLSRLGLANLSVFEIGQIKHHVQLDEQGRVASEGVLCRVDREEFLYTAGSGDWLQGSSAAEAGTPTSAI